MKKNSFVLAEFVRSSTSATITRALLLYGAIFLARLQPPAHAAELQLLRNHVPAAATNATMIRRSSRWERLDLTIGLPLKNQAELTNLLRQLYDPASTNYHQFLSPEQFAERFSPSAADYEQVVNFARTHGLIVTATHPNRTLVSVKGSVAEVERAFHVTLNEYQHPTEARTFRAPSVEPSLDLAVPVLAISGLDNYVIPRPCFRVISTNAALPALTGSGPGGYYLGSDFRHAYVPATPLTGTGQAVGLVEFDGYFHQDVASYEALAGLPNVPVTTVLLDGFNGSPGVANVEVSLDIDMAVSMAPGLSQVIVYEGTIGNDILNRIATDKLVSQASASWTYGINATTLQIYQQFAAQGQSFFNSSGDGGAYAAAPSPPTDVPYITVVGGTDLTTASAGGAWSSEVAWPSSGGGISTTYSIPSYQQGLSMAANQGSTTFRNLPDVAMVADNCYLVANNGQGLFVSGTSISSPLWAAFTALVNQFALTNGEPTVGFINPAVYAIGKGSNALPYTTLFHDITSGNNHNSTSPTRFSAVPGYDLCTGWGSPTGSNLISALAFPESLQISPATGFTSTGPVGGPFNPAMQLYSLTNNAGAPLAWSVSNPSSMFIVSPTSGMLVDGGSAMIVTLSLNSAVSNLPPGSYSTTLLFTNLNDNFVQTRQAVLAVVTPPVITVQPASEALLVGTTADFSVGIASNALMSYQWGHDGTNLSDGGNVSGSATSVLTITNVSSNSVGNYFVTLSNAAGVLVSSNASLTLMPSAPVIVQQPTNLTVLPGAPASFSVAAVGDVPYFYRWMDNGTNLNDGPNFSGVMTSTLTISNVSTPNVGIYSVIVSNTLGSMTSTGAVLSVIPISPPGISLSTLWSFGTGTSGEFPYSPLVQLGPNLYGTTIGGGANAEGTIFRISTSGLLLTLFSFATANGTTPYAGLDFGRDGFLYGDTFLGNIFGDGIAYKITTSGGTLFSLTKFNGNNGANPVAGLVQGSDNNFYGTSYQGGTFGYGTVFRYSTGGALTNLFSFNYSDGGFPSGVLVQGSDGNFYGTTENGGTNGGAGTVFKVTPTGVLTTLYSFTGSNNLTGPIAGVIQGVDGNFYGTTLQTGANNLGTVFKITPAGELTTLYTFSGGSDGANPWGGLIQAKDGNLYGTTQSGGTYSFGTVFQIAPTGSLTTVLQFDGYNGSTPSASLLQGMDGNLYGTTEAGGSIGVGSVFRLSIGGALQITGQPADQTAYVGGAALFTVATSGNGPVFYQWLQDGTNLTDGSGISGSRTATLRITNIVFNDAAVYSVVVSNADTSILSDDAVLQVIFSPANITSQPVSQTVVAGATAVFSLTATGDAPLSYQWQENGTNLTDGGNISGSATSTLTLANVALTDSGNYSVTVGNPNFTAFSHMAQLGVVPVSPPSASATSLFLFSDGNDGAYPYAGLIQARDGNLYGTAEGGGTSFQGSIFKVPLSGTQTTIFNFPLGTAGAKPFGRLAQGLDGNYYGTTSSGGTNGNGTLFRMASNNAVTFLYSFTGGVDGAAPMAGLVQATDGNFYGTASTGGAHSSGALFRLTPAGAITPLYSFTGGPDGAFPFDGLIQGRDGKLYGTTLEGGADGFGTVFSLTTNGLLTILASFNFSNGAFPQAGLIQAVDGTFYGTTLEGGATGDGTVFSLTTNGLFSTVFEFGFTNGSGPAAEILQGTDGNLYGTTSTGGIGGQGSVFKLTTNGTLSTLLWFDGFNGSSPNAALVQASNGIFYGTTPLGGTAYKPAGATGNGTIFRVTVPIFITSTLALKPAIATLPYASTLANLAVAPTNDPLSFAKVSGPAWLTVATNGTVSGTAANSDVGTNVFSVSLTDSNGVSASATLRIAVLTNPPPTFFSNPFSEPWANVGQIYSGTISTNATATNLNAGDVLTFGKASGPAWLNVATNGTLSGTPQSSDAGSNTFVVTVTDLGGTQVSATLSLYVNSPPMFASGNFTKPAGTVGIPYVGTIAANASDPDLAAGDALAFYKISGPAWLNVAINGSLSGTPAGTNSGVNTFLLVVIDSGGLSGIGSLGIFVTTDNPPTFTSSPFTGPPGKVGQAYFGTVATNASDPDFGDLLTFSKISGPNWLSVSTTGALSGTPISANAGTNIFVINVADLDGLSNSASLFINVLAAPIMARISAQNTNLLLGWTGGAAPYQVQMTTNLSNPFWQNLGIPTSGTNQILSPSNAAAFYRIQGE